VQQELVGSALRSFRFRKSGAEEAIKGTDRFRQRYLVELETGDAVTTFDWIAIISPDFDVDPRPRISHRAAT
jgi:hypothetical protein